LSNSVSGLIAIGLNLIFSSIGLSGMTSIVFSGSLSVDFIVEAFSLIFFGFSIFIVNKLSRGLSSVLILS